MKQSTEKYLSKEFAPIRKLSKKQPRPIVLERKVKSKEIFNELSDMLEKMKETGLYRYVSYFPKTMEWEPDFWAKYVSFDHAIDMLKKDERTNLISESRAKQYEKDIKRYFFRLRDINTNEIHEITLPLL